MPNIAYVNNRWTSLASAKVNVEDRGFQFGDGVYELIRTYDSRPFHLTEHLERLKISAAEIQIPLRDSISKLEKIVHTGCHKSGHKEIKIYIQVTRGPAPRLHAFPKQVRPTVVMTFRKLVPIADAVRKKGLSVISVPDIRWGRCHVKSLNLLPNVLAREQAIQSGAEEALFIRNGKVTEGSGSNLFSVFGKTVITPPTGPYLLSGITRELILQIGKREGISIIEKELSFRRFKEADEIFLTGTTLEVMSVVKLDQQPIGGGSPGPMTEKLFRLFKKQVKHVPMPRNMPSLSRNLGYT